MKRVFGRILLCVSALAGVVGCGESLQPRNSGSGSATVLAYMPQEKGGYALQKFELIGISDIKEVAGRFVNFFVSPKIIKLDGKEKMDGQAPHAQFIRNSAGDYIASDNLTIELFTIYAHMQRLAALDDELGAKGVNKWPRDIGVAVRAEGGMVNNAQYYGPADVMYFVRYTKSELPVQVNAGVLAHEHFHSLFYKMVPAPPESRTSLHHLVETSEAPAQKTEILKAPNDSEVMIRALPVRGESERNADTDQEMREVYFGGLNEGFADFWGWMYTGDPDFVAMSLPEYKATRTLNSGGETPDYLLSLDRIYVSLGNIKEQLKNKSEMSKDQQGSVYSEARVGLKYQIGTRFSRMLKDLAGRVKDGRKMSDQESRKFVAKALVKILPLLTFKDISPEFVVQTLATAMPELQENECDYLRSSVQVVDYAKTWSCEKSGSQWNLQMKKAE